MSQFAKSVRAAGSVGAAVSRCGGPGLDPDQPDLAMPPCAHSLLV